MNGDDLYDDEGSTPNTPTSEAEPEHAEEGGEPENEPTALLPKSILAGKDFKVGDEVVLKITGMHEDEVQVEYAPAKGAKSESSEMSSMYD